MFRGNLGSFGNPQPKDSNKKPEGHMSQNVPSVGSEARRQPTYTTVGSVYNPNAAMPLQPPTRRPRTRRYQPPIRSTSGNTFFPFPDALLSALPVKDGVGPTDAPGTTAAPFRQYSPLQQNYDRAATPVTERESSALSGTGMSAPSIRSGNLPSQAGSEGNDNAGSEDTLASSRITVKGLTNLASYPNPMQRAAQKALARARIANLGLYRPSTPSSLPSATLDPGKDRLASTYGTASAVAGPPQPLTAGPPGQRQFKSTPLDVVSRSLRMEDQAAPLSPTASLFQPRSLSSLSTGLAYATPGNLRPALDEDNNEATEQPNRLPTDETYHDLGSQALVDHAASRPLSTPGPSDMPTEAFGDRKILDTLPPDRIKKYYPEEFPSNYDGRYKPVAENWHTKYPIVENGTGRVSLSERRSKINRSFYSGTEGLVKNMEQIVRDHNYRCLENKIGVIGGERERLRGSHIERLGSDGKVQPPHLSVEEVNEMDGGDAAKPLLNMAFATLLSYKEESESGTSAQNAGPSGFTKA